MHSNLKSQTITNPHVNIFWFRRDLRLEDNAGLYQALKDGLPVIPIFIFDRYILDKLEEKNDRRVSFIYSAVEELQRSLMTLGSSLLVYHGFPEKIFEDLLVGYKISKVFTNHDYEPYAIERDSRINELLKNSDISLVSYKDQVIFDKNEVIKDDGRPYTVFTPYSKRWKSKLNDHYLKEYPNSLHYDNFYKQPALQLPSLHSLGFLQKEYVFPSKLLDQDLISKYSKQRDFPGKNGTSKIGVHLRFGTVSVRVLASRAQQLNETYLNELIWRDFYQMILWHFQKVGKGHAFKQEYEMIQWRNDEKEFELWCEGKTGYPLVDAGMRELNATGFMHNRVRMVVASFLCKHLLIDWRWGEAYFANKLLDFDLASNNGGWQWASGSGCDAAPYFRIFNPYLQTKKFDPELNYVNTWVPELNEFTYPPPIVEHEFARKRCLEVYGKALKRNL